MGSDPDRSPVDLRRVLQATYPESAYLKVLICAVW